ncbi:MAG TPA: replication initiation protein [Candidatus Gastranaerophilaceae bacterium]|nr:replication initiation protein [Candidatus Gastranaerophilaceae bacterium]
MNSEKAMMIKKNSALIQVHAKTLSAIQRKIINSLIYTMQRTTGQQGSYNITISALKKFCNISMIGNNELKDSFKGLADIKLEFNYLNKDKNEVWEYMSLLSRVKIVPNEGNIIFELPEFLRDKLINPRLYAPIDIVLIAGFKSSYSIVLYELMRDYLKAPSVPMMTIEDFRNLLGIKSNEYKCFNDLKKRVLDVAVKEVNEKTDICCNYDLIKEVGIRNKYSHIHFFVSKKPVKPAYEENETIKIKDDADYSMDLFEESVSLVNKTVVQIPEGIMSVVPEDHRTAALKTLLSRFLEKGNEYVISNIKYSLEHFQENFIGYLKVALENDYACHVREAQANIREAAVKKSRQIEQKEKAKQAVHNDHAEILKKIENLVPDKLKPIHNKFDEIVTKSGIKPEFLTDTVKESLMIEAYKALHVVNAYSAPDQD